MKTCPDYLLAKKHTDAFFKTYVEPEEGEFYPPVLDVVNDPGCIRAVLSSYGKPLSGRKDGNIQNLKDLAKDLGRTLIFHKVTSQE